MCMYRNRCEGINEMTAFSLAGKGTAVTEKCSICSTLLSGFLQSWTPCIRSLKGNSSIYAEVVDDWSRNHLCTINSFLRTCCRKLEVTHTHNKCLLLLLLQQQHKYKHYLYILAVSEMAASVNVRSCWVADTVEVDAWLIKYSDVSFCGDGAWNRKTGI